MHSSAAALPRVQVVRNRDGLLFGCTWSHHPSWTFRTTHVYLGLWVLTIRTGPLDDA